MRVRRVLKALALVILTAVLVPLTTAGTILGSFIFLPLPASLPEPKRGIEDQISRVYDINGDLIGTFRKFEVTEPVAPDDIPEVLRQAVVAAEDRRFYQHGGFDIRGTLRALWADVRNREASQGGSTITQQYVKNAYVGNERSISRKVREAILASQLDRTYSKDEILFRYLQQVPLGEGAHGVGAAAETYFRKNVRDIGLSEAAMLAGLIPAPSFYEPRGNPPAAELKRKLVLKKMLDEGFISQEQYDVALPKQVWVGSEPPPGAQVTRIYPREEQRQRYPYFMDYLRRYLVARYGEEAIYTRGFRIYTTLDPRVQDAAQREVAETLDGAPLAVEMGLAAVEPGSGFVKALVGGRDFYAPGGQVNLALGGSTGRQTGSSFKPFVLAEALEQGVSPDKRYSGRNPFGLGDYEAHNYGNSQYGEIDLRAATKNSVNTVYVQLLNDVGVEATMDLANRMGLARSVYRADVHGLAVALGTQESSPLEMASAYGVWAARGLRADPTPLVYLLDSQGRVVEDNRQPETRRIQREEIADTMNDILRGPLEPGGTAGGRGLGAQPAAGKTGTTQDNGNAWFVGYTPQLSTAVWIGNRANQRPMGPVKGVRSVTGGTWPARTWQAFMKEALKGRPVVDFSEPAPITEVADEAKRASRRGFDVARRRSPAPAPGSDDLDRDPPPLSVAPPTTTSTTTTTSPVIVGF
jgi:penicillin-binding protein 1A